MHPAIIVVGLVTGGLVSLSGLWFADKQITTALDLLRAITPSSPITYAVILMVLFVFAFLLLRKRASSTFALILIPMCLMIVGIEKSIFREMKKYEEIKQKKENTIYISVDGEEDGEGGKGKVKKGSWRHWMIKRLSGK